jgi:hypothetical protein
VSEKDTLDRDVEEILEQIVPSRQRSMIVLQRIPSTPLTPEELDYRKVKIRESLASNNAGPQRQPPEYFCLMLELTSGKRMGFPAPLSRGKT